MSNGKMSYHQELEDFVNSNMTRKQELEDFIQLRVDEWLLDNPEPGSNPNPRPSLPKSQFSGIMNGFVVFEPIENFTVNFHISKNGEQTICIKLHLSELQSMLEAALEVQSGLAELSQWKSFNEGAENKMHLWKTAQGQVISEAKREFERLQIESA